jgi:hypothetical protein
MFRIICEARRRVAAAVVKFTLPDRFGPLPRIMILTVRRLRFIFFPYGSMWVNDSNSAAQVSTRLNTGHAVACAQSPHGGRSGLPYLGKRFVTGTDALYFF